DSRHRGENGRDQGRIRRHHGGASDRRRGARHHARSLGRIGEATRQMSFEPHPWRGAVLGEVHARPFAAIASPLRVVHFAFLTDHELAQRDAIAFQEFMAARGQRGPERSSKHHLATFADATVRWEQHAEFTTYTWEQPGLDEAPFATAAAVL